MLSTRLDLLFTIKEFPANFDGFKPVSALKQRVLHPLCIDLEFLMKEGILSVN